MMRVKDLIKALRGLPNQDAAIVMSSDPEGNEFFTVEEIGGTDDEPIIWPGVAVSLDDDEDEGDEG